MTIPEVDVFICGGGPVGLATSYQLVRLGLTTYTIEKYDRIEQDTYGRASSLYTRSVEMLDQVDLAEPLLQMGFVSRMNATFKDGEKIAHRGWSSISKVTDTYMDYSLHLRQKYSERIFKEALEKLGGRLHVNEKLVYLRLRDDAEDDYKVELDVERADGEKFKIRAKYLVGADGGKSAVRHLTRIPFEGQQTDDNWVRIDAVLKTNIPDARIGTGSVESPEHGNILLVALDHGATRIGFSLTPELYKKYNGSLSLEDVIHEAKRAVKPFSIEFERVDWFTVYNIGQRVAARFQDQERILLAGDAAHTHSSGAAQGMNTGMHDSINLGWKLAGVLKGLYKPQVLETYNSERRPVAQHLINLDKTFSAIVSGRSPDHLTSSAPNVDSNQLFAKFLADNADFTTGLGVYYETNNVLNKDSPLLSIMPGHRAPDVLVQKPGSRLVTRLYEITKNYGKYWIVVFAGQPHLTSSGLKSLRQYLDRPDSFTKQLKDVFNFCTIIACPGLQSQADEIMGVEKFGYACFDPTEAAHIRYGVPSRSGAVAVIRPDGILGFATSLNDGHLIGEYFNDIVLAKGEV